MDPRRFFAALAFVSPALSVFGAPPELPPAAGKPDVTYATDIRPIFETSCIKCHGAQRHRGGLRLDSLEAALAGGEDGKVIVPGDSVKSPLVLAVAQVDPDTSMPPPRKSGPSTKLSPEQIGLLRAWIDQGAK
jgi:mono/diheme cytochrome c family protein